VDLHILLKMQTYLGELLSYGCKLLMHVFFYGVKLLSVYGRFTFYTFALVYV